MQRLLKHTKKTIKLSDYAQDIIKKINVKIDPLLETHEYSINKTKKVIEAINQYLDKYSDFLVTIAFCHGDFQFCDHDICCLLGLSAGFSKLVRCRKRSVSRQGISTRYPDFQDFF